MPVIKPGDRIYVMFGEFDFEEGLFVVGGTFGHIQVRFKVSDTMSDIYMDCPWKDIRAAGKHGPQ